MTAPLIEVHDDADALATAVAGELLSRLADLQSSGVEPQVALTGGTIADAMHREVARLAPESGVDFSKVVFWFGDERFVAADDPDRNVGQVRRAFLDAVGATQVHAMPSTADAADVDEAAEQYSALLREHGAGQFDLVMFGVGPDGHVASLFPGHPALDAPGPAVGVRDAPKPPPMRVSLSLEALNRSRVVWFLASGDGKAEAVATALAEGPDDASLPSVSDCPARGVVGSEETTWWLDQASASRL
ncbi:MAG: 6-phosphogluconolactonase [Nocardioides sp.]|nr:6-phosphogluconolactonase [Nocardioides sp.]